MLRLCVCLVLGVSLGCLPRTVVRKDPGPRDCGIRYYRPKPYLLVKPYVTPAGEPSGALVDISLQYLPDFSQEYSIHIRSGLGTNQTQVALDQGWNLKSINVDIDSQFDENLEAVARLVDTLPLPSAVRAPGASQGFVIRATNVPLGYYEAVVAKYQGQAHLYGFRYVGFLPFSACPITAGGPPEPFCCNQATGALYGLVFDNGVMTFKCLDAIRALEESPELNVASRQFDLDRLPPVVN